MPVNWEFANSAICLGGHGRYQIAAEDALRQELTATAVLEALRGQPGVVLADEVGMGKTYVALAVAASVLLSTRDRNMPVMVMMPPGLAQKWQAEWQQFKALCSKGSGALDWVRESSINRPTDLFREIENTKPHLIWLTTNCFSKGLQDPWIKLGLIRLARSRTRMDEGMRKRVYHWATSFARLRSVAWLTSERVEQLMAASPERWGQILVREGLLDEGSGNPIPEHLLRHQDELDWSGLVAVLRGESMPKRRSHVYTRRVKEARDDFNEACQDLYWDWLDKADWRASLLILDEAHHAKNDCTRLASLLRSEETSYLLEAAEREEESKPLLWEKFDRMLFLTATPFQLGHQELIRVLRSFASARWTRQSAPDRSRAEFLSSLGELERRLDENRLAGRRLDRLWGKLTPAHVSETEQDGADPTGLAARWWGMVSAGTEDPLAKEIVRAVEECRQTKLRAEQDSNNPWAALRTWVIRHNRSPWLPKRDGCPDISRRQVRHGDTICVENKSSGSGSGLLLAGDAALPFLLAARAQGELAVGGSKARAFFAEGLCSSYEAFHHTREGRGDVRDVNDYGEECPPEEDAKGKVRGVIPVSWYEGQIERLIPSRSAAEDERLRHPKVRAVVQRVVDLWLKGEKVLIFCFYRETVKGLYEHLNRAIENATIDLAARKLNLDPERQAQETRDWLGRIARRFADRDSPFHREIASILREPLEESEFAPLKEHADTLVELLSAFIRSPSFIARYLPLEDVEVRQALEEGESRGAIIRAGVNALRHALTDRRDASEMSMLGRVREFLRFACELVERGRHATEGDADEDTPLGRYLDAVATYMTRQYGEDGDRGEAEGTFRAGRPVRMVYGDTKQDIRQRLMLAFNSPLFPEILISSAVLGEGVDLHRFCRHVIHHDLCWNPSTLEQRTGRLDRIRCKAEVAHQPILIFEPFLAGSADEKMFRVVRDRERWFQIVMGQKFEFDEAASEALASRLPLPEELASELIFDLRRWKPLNARTESGTIAVPKHP